MERSRRRRFVNSKTFQVFLLVLILTFILGVLNHYRPELPKRLLEDIVLPFQRASNYFFHKVESTWENYINLVNLKEENEKLKKEIKKLRFEQSLLVEKNKEYERIEKMIKAEDLLSIPFEIAMVVAKSPNLSEKIVIIDKGERDGIKKGMPVISDEGLVGRIIFTSKKGSKVLLITDVRSAVDSISQHSRERMVIQGNNANSLDLLYLDSAAKIEKGEPLLSSGLGGLFPKGILIGEVSELEDQPGSLFKKGKMIPYVDISRLEEVFVLKVEENEYESLMK